MNDKAVRFDYVLPLRWTDDDGLDELTEYLAWLGERGRVIVVDGSPDLVFARHEAAWSSLASHVRPDPIRGLNGKVPSVLTGMRLATAERVVIADDDVRYDDTSLTAVLSMLDEADLVGPQNVFRPLPWHARWDTGRTLLNRAFGADYPGTFAVRRSTFIAAGGYSPDVLFENLELMRTIEAVGGTVHRPRGVYVLRQPPTARHFVKQRVRQAYDDQAQPVRLVALLSLGPTVAYLLGSRRYAAVGAGALASVAVAELGRRRDGGRAVFPPSSAGFAPLWLAERSVCVWLALGVRLTRGGVKYRDYRVKIAAHSSRWLRKSYRESGASRPFTAGGEVRQLVRTVAERLES